MGFENTRASSTDYLAAVSIGHEGNPRLPETAHLSPLLSSPPSQKKLGFLVFLRGGGEGQGREREGDCWASFVVVEHKNTVPV